ncbi:MAG: threonine synthase [Candidatus Marinimicrobia bacterium]|nr:threonine synthase [Candidatus Neomarinimicrobiota bacterium]
MAHIGYTCVSCGDFSPADPFHYTCEKCGANLDAVYDYDQIKKDWSRKYLLENRNRSIWRYLPILPVNRNPEASSIQVGGTPLVRQTRLAQKLGIKNLWLKDDTRNPSGSLKDRATEVGIQHAKELGFETIVAASTGNAAASLACLSAVHKMDAVIFTPSSAPPAKLTQILQYGAQLFPVDGTYDNAFDLSMEVVKAAGWYLRSTGINPILSEGKKTVALEIAEQLNWDVPDQVFVPVGDGCIIGGVYKGFYDLNQLGWIDHIPKIIAVQAEGSAAIVHALTSGTLTSVKADTVADSISVDMPRDGQKAIRAVKESNGYGLKVTDAEILAAQHRLAKTTGVFAEPAAATAFAGLLKSVNKGKINSDETATVLITGTGLKDINTAQKLVNVPSHISPDLESFNAAWTRLNG